MLQAESEVEECLVHRPESAKVVDALSFLDEISAFVSGRSAMLTAAVLPA